MNVTVQKDGVSITISKQSRESFDIGIISNFAEEALQKLLQKLNDVNSISHFMENKCITSSHEASENYDMELNNVTDNADDNEEYDSSYDMESDSFSDDEDETEDNIEDEEDEDEEDEDEDDEDDDDVEDDDVEDEIEDEASADVDEPVKNKFSKNNILPPPEKNEKPRRNITRKCLKAIEDKDVESLRNALESYIGTIKLYGTTKGNRLWVFRELSEEDNLEVWSQQTKNGKRVIVIKCNKND